MKKGEKICSNIFRTILIGLIILILFRFIIPRTSLYYRVKLYRPVFGNYLNEYDLILIKGESERVYVKNVNVRVRYESTDFKVAYVNNFGKVTAKRNGLCYIKVHVNGKVLKCRVRVISLNRTSVNLSVGSSRWLNVRGSVFRERYYSSDKSIVKVSRFGKITAVSKGTATITVKAYGREMKCKVVVR